MRRSEEPCRAIASARIQTLSDPVTILGPVGLAGGRPGSAQAAMTSQIAGLVAPLLRLNEAQYLDGMRGTVAVANRPLCDVRGPAWLTGAEAIADAVPRAAFVARALLSPLVSLAAGRDWDAMRLREFEVALELKLYHGQHGSYPASLEELERAIGHSLPRDPFSGKQFAYQRKGEGFTLNPTGLDALPQRTRETLEDRRMTWEDER